MRALYTAGINSFNVYRLDEASSVERFPVFIPQASGTTRRAPTLLNNAGELSSALAAISSEALTRAGLMIVELKGSTDEGGLFRKYGAFRVGKEVYPQHVVVSRQWYAKFPTYRGNPELKRSQNAYFNDVSHIDQHTDKLSEAFALANIEYGRIDYCVVNGRVEVFEINTNPSILANPPTRFDRFDYGLWADRHAETLLRLQDAMSEGDGALAADGAVDNVHKEVVAALSAKFARRKLKLTARLGFQRLAAAVGMRN